jgi:hypothetical protein
VHGEGYVSGDKSQANSPMKWNDAPEVCSDNVAFTQELDPAPTNRRVS